MSNAGTGSPALSPFRVMLCVSAYAMMSMYAMMFVVSALGAAVTLQEKYGWLLRGEVCYSAGWTEEQRSAVESFRKKLPFRSDDIYFAFCKEDVDDYLDRYTWAGVWQMDEQSMFVAADVDRHVRMLVEGKTEDLPADVAYGSPAHVAAALGYPEAVRALVEHDAGMIQKKDRKGRALITCVLTALGECEPQPVLELADWLIAQGASPEQDIFDFDVMVTMSQAKGGNEILEWLLAHDISLKPWASGQLRGLPFDVFVREGWGLDVFERLVKTGKIDINDRRADWTYLQFVQIDYPQPEITERLLKLGANPNLLPEPYSVKGEDGDEYGSIERSALALVLEHYAMEEEADSEISKSSLATLKLLLSYGASSQPFPDVWLNEENRRAAEAAYRDFGHTINNLTKETGL